MSEVNIFEQATKTKLRFQSTIGTITTEDLWELSLTGLDAIAKVLYKQLKESTEFSLIKETTGKQKVLELQFDIVKHIIGVKLEEKEKVAARKEKAARKQLLLEALAEKQTETLKSKSVDELQKELLELGD